MKCLQEQTQNNLKFVGFPMKVSIYFQINFTAALSKDQQISAS